jgi:hypothetical protein
MHRFATKEKIFFDALTDEIENETAYFSDNTFYRYIFLFNIAMRHSSAFHFAASRDREVKRRMKKRERVMQYTYIDERFFKSR